MKRPSMVALVVSALISAAAFAKYTADVQQVPNITERIRTLAVAPAQCPDGIDCLLFETRLMTVLERQKVFKLVSPTRVRQALFEMGAKDVTGANRATLLTTLQADAIAMPTIGGASKSSELGVATAVAPGTAIYSTVEESHINTSLEIVAADGKVLFQGTGAGTSDWNSMEWVVVKAFVAILDKGFPKSHK